MTRRDAFGRQCEKAIPGRCGRACWAGAGCLLIVLVLLGQAAAAAGVARAPGRGYRLEALDLTLGGYATLEVNDLEGRRREGRLSDLSLFLTWEPTPRVRLFSELELDDPVRARSGARVLRAEPELERLYADVAVTPALELRIGKFLTPIGYWNEVHADPLVWTTSRPLVTDALFPRHATGAMVHGEYAGFELQVFGDVTRSLDPLRQEEALEGLDDARLPPINFEHAAGLHLRRTFAGERLHVGVAWTRFAQRGERAARQLVGSDVRWTGRRVELALEAAYRIGEGRAGDAWGAYVQAAAPVHRSVSAVVRAELYAPADDPDTVRAGIIGIAWRPRAGLVLKWEFRAGTHNERLAPDGWLGSAALLF